ncbi:sensor histidine kinase [Paramagnetospirillum kuznetsovii]|uniref:histidine kinase n=1 Tax=Paramagnetospirillum kuznetsovii TaxID=2053833 RepID=A0A364NT21_9PROT|nr:PhnD/SsuA/transferrin family substrate-binding protein [Paramagnetospirillum kuznetsovii]RAU20231.1 sensor histidine kinase [Paramagnetospirillum kuznetsovii]
MRVLLILSVLLGWSAVVSGAEAPSLRIGVLAFRGAEMAESEWEPTLAYLRGQLPQRHVVIVPLDLDGLTTAVKSGSLDFVITNPGHYVELEAAFGVTRIASLSGSASATTLPAMVGSAVVVRAERTDLNRLSDLRGSRLAAVSPEAFGGFRVVWRELAEIGIAPFSDTAGLQFTGFPMEAVAEAVAEGKADAGILRFCLLEQMEAEGRITPGLLRVLGGIPSHGCLSSTRLYPDWPFARLAATPEALAKQVAIALLAMPEGDGYAWTVPADYQPVHDLFRALKIGPYAYLRHPSARQLLRDYWPWLVMALLGVVWWLVHVARVEYLVRRRTAELRSAHAEARLRREEMEHGARLALLGEMASSLAHEISQPLAAIANYASGCQRRLTSHTDPEGVTEGVGLIAAQAERAAGIVKRIRAFARKRSPVPQNLDANGPLVEAVELFQTVAARHGVGVSLDLGQGLPPVLADRLRIEQVVLNLLQNAADAMSKSEPRHIAVSSSAVAEGVEIRVADTGPGLSPEARARLFEPFFTTKPDGLGLGLSLSRTMIEAQGGRLWAEDAPGGGAVFRFTLPVTTGPTEIP